MDDLKSLKLEVQILAIRRDALGAQRDALTTEIEKLLALPCPACKGRGYTEEAKFGSNEQTWIEVTSCEACGGSGRLCGISDEELSNYVD